ncbi:MAG: DUF530 domain-containing protein [archaeon]|nr:DUF530 domain-containing protein [archaeon]
MYLAVDFKDQKGDIMDESSMIIKSERFLNQIENEEIDLSNLGDLDSFIDVYTTFTNRSETLQNMREIMDESGYTAPYRSLNRYGSSFSSEAEFEEITEINRHNQFFRAKASAKSNSFDRVKSAIDAHRIAIGNLEEYAKIKCKKCSKSYRASTFINNNKVCKCGCEDFELKINHQGVYRLEIIPYLPLSGNYMVLMSDLSYWGRESFKRILNVLQQKRKSVVKTVSPIIKIYNNGREIKKRVSLDSEFADCYEEEVRRRYGKKVRIERLEFHKTKPSIINDKNTRTALALAYAKHAEDIILKYQDEILKENFENLDKIEIYDEIIKSVNLEKPNFIETADDLEEWRKDKIDSLLEEMGLVDKYGNLNHGLRKDLDKREKLKRDVFANIGPTLITWDLFRYYLCTSNDRRKRYGSPFPYIRGDIDRQQRKIFQNPHREVVKLLQEKHNERILSVPEMDLLLFKKFKLEKQIKNSNIKLNYAALGPAIVYKGSDKFTIQEVANAFKVPPKAVEREIEKVKNIQRPRSKNASKFLDLITN